MLIFHDERLAYLANPKTGTRAFQITFQKYAAVVIRSPPEMKHMSAHIFERRFRRNFDSEGLDPIETVAVIRHPIARLNSWYRYRQRDQLSGDAKSTADITFEQFVEAYLSNTPPPYAKVGVQASFVTDKAGELLVHHLFQYERLHLFLKFINARLDKKVEMPLKNQEKQTGTEISSELETRLRDRHALDFELHAALDYGPLSIG